MTVKELIKELLDIDNLDKEIEVEMEFANDSNIESIDGIDEGLDYGYGELSVKLKVDMKDYAFIENERLEELEEAEDQLKELEG